MENNQDQQPVQNIENERDERDDEVSYEEASTDTEDVDQQNPQHQVRQRSRLSTTRRIGDALIQAFRHPLRIRRSTIDEIYDIAHGGGSRRREAEDSNDEIESNPENVESFDTDLPAEHSYLGNLSRVPGVDYLETGKYTRILIFMHHSMIFPGETLPMIIPDYMFDRAMYPEKGLLFGVVFPSMWKTTKPHLYGVTCQVYEKGNDERGNVSILSRAHQRFLISEKHNSNFSEFLRPNQSRKVYANVLILPEIVLPDPLSSIDLGSMNRFRDIKSMKEKLRSMQSASTIWPKYIYDQYNITSTIERAKKCLSVYKINAMPNDHVLLSFWLGQNLLFDPTERIKLFLTDSVNVRMQIIEKCLDNEKYFCCRRCKNQIANCNSLFAMSKHGVQSNYCNPSGFIHETNTVYTIKSDSIYPTGAPSTEFSWFPGYSWQIILCRMCDIHIGWKFASTKSNLVPKKFYGLSGTNVLVDISNEGEASNIAQQSSPNSGGLEEYLLLYENPEE